MVEVDVIRGKGVCVDDPGASGKDLFSLVIQWTDGREIGGFFLQSRYCYLVCEGGRMGGKKEGGWEGRRREDGREEGREGRREEERERGKKGERKGEKKSERERREGGGGREERKKERGRKMGGGEEEREKGYRLWYSLIRCRVYLPPVQCSLHGPQSPDTSQQGLGDHCL